MMTVAEKQPRTPAQYGRDAEKDAEKRLRKDGWTVTRSHLSRGAADLVAIDAFGRTRMIQVKSCQIFRPTAFNRGIMEILAAPAVWERCVYGYVWSKGHAITVTITANGSITVEGKEPYRAAVADAVAKLSKRIAQASR
jgi:hypothetical protein